ncbi:MAG: OsmC family protein [Fimbriimonadaceae bacterium]|nr:OsmC family protein [Fimbriimonadaceae bacterium]
MTRKGSAVWSGGLTDGKGTVSTESGILQDTQYSFSSRFESGTGTNPEELIAAAHAGCFSMAFSLFLGNAGLTADKIETTAEVQLNKVGEGFAIDKIKLITRCAIPGATEEQFQELAEAAKANCPVSKLYAGAEITLDAQLV